MKKGKLTGTLPKLSTEEMARFRDFVRSPYFNSNLDLSRLLDLILHEVRPESDIIDGPGILRKLYPGEDYSLRKLTDLLYELTNLLEDFLAVEFQNQNQFSKKLNIMALTYEKKLDPLLNGLERDLENLHGKNNLRDSNYFLDFFLMQTEREKGFRLMGKIAEKDSLQIKTDHLDLFYFTSKLKDACEMLNRTRIVAVHYQLNMVDLIVPYLTAHPELYGDIPSVQVYLYAWLMLTGEHHEEHFFMLKNKISESESCFGKDELRTIYGYLQNYCIRRINQGNSAFVNELFTLYKLLLSNGLVFGDDRNMQWEFKNFVSIGLRLKEYEWTLEMIPVFKNHLPESVRENAYTYNLSNYYYETGDYKKAVRLLNSVEFMDIYYNLDAKVMLLKIYYTLEEEESFYALVSSFGIYLRRNKFISAENAEVYHNLIRFTRKAFLLKTKLPYQRKKTYAAQVKQLQDAINETQKIANINWLRNEVSALYNQ